MSDFLDEWNDVFRDKTDPANPASPVWWPPKPDVRDVGATLDARVGNAETMASSGVKWLASVRVGLTSNVTLSTIHAGTVVDGVTLATNDRVALMGQTAGQENGLWVAPASGSPTRATDADTETEIVGMSFFVREGTAGAGKQYTCTTKAPIVPGTTPLAFQLISDQSALNANITSLQNQVTALSGRVTTNENDLKPVAVSNEGTKLYYDHTGITGAALRTLFLPLNWQVKRGTSALVNATLAPASSRLSTHYEFVVGSSNTTPYFVYFDTASGTIGSLAQTALPDARGTMELICVIANGQVHCARFEVINLMNDIPWGQLDFAVVERDRSTGRPDTIVLPILRGHFGTVSNLTPPDAGRFYKTFTAFGASAVETICLDFTRFRAGQDPYIRVTNTASSTINPNNRMIIELLRSSPGGNITSRVGLRIVGDGVGGTVRNQCESGIDTVPDVATLPNWTNTPANAPTVVDVTAADDPDGLAYAMGFRKAWFAPNTASKQMLVGAFARNAVPGTYVMVRIWALSPADNVYDTAGLLAQAMSDTTSIGITFAVERVYNARLFTVMGMKKILNTEDLNYVRAGWNSAANRYKICGIQIACGHQSPSWIMWDDFPKRRTASVFIPRKINWFSDKKLPFAHNFARVSRRRLPLDGYPYAGIEWKRVDKSDAGFVDLPPIGARIDTSEIYGDCNFVQDRLDDSPGNYDFTPFELEVVPTSALNLKNVCFISIGDSTAQVTGKGAFLKQICQRGGAIVDDLGSFDDTDWDGIVTAKSEGRSGKKLADYAGIESGLTPINGTAGNAWSDYIAGDAAFRRARVPFLRIATGSDPPADCFVHSFDGNTYTVDMIQYLTQMGWYNKNINLFDFTMVFNDLGSTVPPDSWNHLLQAMDIFYRRIKDWATARNRLQLTHICFTVHGMAWGDVVTTNSYKWNFRHAPAYQMMLDWHEANAAGLSITRAGGNVGNGTIYDIKVRDTSDVGSYSVELSSGTAFTVKKPDGTVVGTGTAAAAPGTRFIGGGLEFMIQTGSVAWTNGDKFGIKADKCLHLNPGHLTCSSIAGWDYSLDNLGRSKRLLSASGQIHTRDANTRMLATHSAAILAKYA